MSTKGCVGLFLLYLDVELFAKIKKRPGFYTLVFTLLLITQDLNKTEKVPNTLW